MASDSGKWRLYRDADGSDCYCGVFGTLAAAQAAAQRGPRGLEKALWDTFRAAGGARACEAPDKCGADNLDTLVWVLCNGSYDAGYYAVRVI